MSSLAECVTYCDQIFTFPKTVRLRISLQHISDLVLLMQCNTLPHIEDLHITMETGIYTSHQLDNRYENASCSILCPNHLNTTGTNLPHLRVLQLRQVAISNVIVLIQHVKSMCQLESLILVNCNVKDNVVTSITERFDENHLAIVILYEKLLLTKTSLTEDELKEIARFYDFSYDNLRAEQRLYKIALDE